MAPQLADAQDADSRGIPADARKRYELLEDCREIVITRLAKVVGEALNRMSDELTALALKSVSRDEQQALLDAVAIVRQHRPEIEIRFRRSFGDVFERRLFNKAAPQGAGTATSLSELSLVDDTAIRDQIVVDKLISRARSRLDPDEVLGVRARLAALLERDWFEENAHPASPEAVFEALKAALAELAPQPDVKSALLQAFEPHVTANLNFVYSNINEKLRANRVLPKIRQRVVTSKSNGRAPGAGAGAPGGGAAGGVAAGHGGGSAGFSAPGGYAAGDLLSADAIAFGIAGAGGGPVGAAGGPAAAGMPGGVAGAAAGARSTPDAVVRDAYGSTGLQQVLHQLAQGQPSAKLAAARMLVDPETFGVADLPMPSVEPPLIDALSTLQADVAAMPMTAPVLLSDLTERARENGSALDQLTVEIVSLVFDYIYADKRLPDLIKQQLLRLQVVAVKAALLDRSFFARRQHPMRRVIDRITEFASDPDVDVAADSPLATGLTEVVDWIIAEFDQDLALFEEALARIERLAQAEAEHRAEKLAEITRQAEREEAIAIARKEARFQFGLRQDRETPAFVRDFLDAWWSSAIATMKVDDGDDADARWNDGLELAEALIWSVAPKFAEEVPRLAAMLPRLISGVMRGLKRTEIPEATREAFFADLLRTHTAAIQAAKALPRSAAAARAPAAPVPAAAGAAPAPATSRQASRSAAVGAHVLAGPDTLTRAETVIREPAASEDTVARETGADAGLAGLTRGDVIELDDSGEPKRFKLAWVSPSRSLYVLTRFGDQARSLTREQLGELFARGLGRVVEGRSTLDHAIASLSVQGRRIERGEAAAAASATATA